MGLVELAAARALASSAVLLFVTVLLMVSAKRISTCILLFSAQCAVITAQILAMAALVVKLAALALTIAVVECSIAKLRMYLVPDFLGVASALAILAVVFTVVMR